VAGQVVQARHEVQHSGTGEVARGGQRAGGEAAHAAGDQDGAAQHLLAVGEPQHRATVGVVERLGGGAQPVLRLELTGLLDQVGDQVPAANRREPSDVEDHFLRVQRGDLATRLGQRIDEHD
jgi:hypothetical protein